MAVLEIVDLAVRRDGRLILDAVSVTMSAGSTLAVIGPNGSGKSTLLRAIAGLETPSRGTIRVQAPGPALVLQRTDVDPHVPLTVRDTVAMGRFPHLGLFRRPRSTDAEAIDRALRRMSITDLANEQIHELSGGQRQRVFVAQGLAQEAPLLLLDEPHNALDLPSQQAIIGAIDEERQAGRAVVVTTHSLADAERCDLVLLLDTTMISCGPPDVVLVEDSLQSVFGDQLVRVGDRLVMDDPHHGAHG